MVILEYLKNTSRPVKLTCQGNFIKIQKFFVAYVLKIVNSVLVKNMLDHWEKPTMKSFSNSEVIQFNC